MKMCGEHNTLIQIHKDKKIHFLNYGMLTIMFCGHVRLWKFSIAWKVSTGWEDFCKSH